MFFVELHILQRYRFFLKEIIRMKNYFWPFGVFQQIQKIIIFADY